MPQESNNSSVTFTSTESKSLLMMVMKGGGVKNLNSNETTTNYVTTEETINDDELAQRKAEAAASRRYQATEWLRKMDQTASEALSKNPSEEEFCLALRNGLILCNILNRVNSGTVSKVVENPIITVQSSDGTAQSAIQYFENMRNFLMAVGDMKLLTFEASDLEKGGSSVKVVECILCLKGYHEWKQAGGTGTWRYGGTVKITSLVPKCPSLTSSENADDLLDDSDCPPDQQLLEFLHHSTDVSLEQSKAANALIFLFDRFGLGLLKAYLTKWNEMEELPVNGMLVDIILKKVVHDFRSLLLSHGNQLGLLLKETLKNGNRSLSREEFLEVISSYLRRRTYDISDDFSKFCTCNGKNGAKVLSANQNVRHLERLELQEQELKDLKSVFQDTRIELKQVQLDWKEELKKLENNIEGLEVASSSYHKLLEENRLLYNQVQDLKGSIRVYCRVRPFLPEQSDCQSTVDYIGENGDIMVVNPHKQGKEARKVFSFNKVFSTNVTQEQVFADTRPLIRSVLDGFNVCIFAYGQTGSGKTYTMSGPDLTTEDTWGVNYRALNDLFQISKARMDVITYEVSVQMIEIYNEQVRDLLVSDGSNRRLDIRNTSQLNGLNVPDASLIPVKCIQDVLDLMRIGQKNRVVGATALNERSSRSHSVLAIHVHGKELVSGSILRGCLHLVDLAGSERVDKSEAVGERLKEAQHINRSLSALGDVISALAQKSSHIPYRNSKLTQVLQDSLGGHAKTLMFVHINPEANAIGETISTLKFAERVASIELGAARSNKETGEIKELKEEISSLKLALQRKEAEMEQLKSGNVQINMDMKSIRTLSPLHMPRNGITGSLKHDILQRPVDETRSTEIRSCSSGKQRRSRLPSKFTDKDPVPKFQCAAEERFVNYRKPRTPSPPMRRSISTDRGALIKSRLKLDTLDYQPAVKLQFPVLAVVNKSVAVLPSMPTNAKVSKVCWASQEQPKVNDVHDTLSNLHGTNSKKLHLEHEEEQFKQVLNVRQGGIRKSKADSKSKAKHQMPVRLHSSDMSLTLLSDKDFGSKGEYSETENVHGILGSPMRGTLKVKKLRQNFTRISQNVERRGLMQAVEPLLAEKQENKLPNSVIRYGKESNKASMPDFRRSRSSPRGKSTVLP